MTSTSLPLDEFTFEAAAADDLERVRKPKRTERINWWLTALIAVLALTVLVPLYFAIVTALKTPTNSVAPASGCPRTRGGRTSPTCGN